VTPQRRGACREPPVATLLKGRRGTIQKGKKQKHLHSREPVRKYRSPTTKRDFLDFSNISMGATTIRLGILEDEPGRTRKGALRRGRLRSHDVCTVLLDRSYQREVMEELAGNSSDINERHEPHTAEKKVRRIFRVKKIKTDRISKNPRLETS